MDYIISCIYKQSLCNHSQISPREDSVFTMQIHLNQRISLILPVNLQLTRVSIQSLQRIDLHYLDSPSNKELSSSSQLPLLLKKLSVLMKRSDKSCSLKSFPDVMTALSHQEECISHKDY